MARYFIKHRHRFIFTLVRQTRKTSDTSLTVINQADSDENVPVATHLRLPTVTSIPRNSAEDY